MVPHLFTRCWNAVKQFWIKMGEAKFTEEFEKNHIASSGGWMFGLFALGLPSQNNSLESDNRWGVRAYLRRHLAKVNVNCPASGGGLVLTVRCLFDEVVPDFSRSPSANSCETYPEPKKEDYIERDRWQNNTNFIKVAPGVYCCRQKKYRGDLSILLPSALVSTPNPFCPTKIFAFFLQLSLLHQKLVILARTWPRSSGVSPTSCP
jgi:hypothetical protein